MKNLSSVGSSPLAIVKIEIVESADSISPVEAGIVLSETVDTTAFASLLAPHLVWYSSPDMVTAGARAQVLIELEDNRHLSCRFEEVSDFIIIADWSRIDDNKLVSYLHSLMNSHLQIP